MPFSEILPGGGGRRAVIGPVLAAAALLLGAATAAAEPPARPPVPVIIDTDIGDDIDDAFAVVLALSDPRLEVVGITAAWGDTDDRVLLIRRLLAALGRGDVPVAQGAPGPGGAPFTQRAWARGAADKSPAPDAIGFIGARAKDRPGRITLLALAPMVNLQALLARDPAAFADLKAVVARGGSIATGYRPDTPGAAAPPSAEYNIASAPEALAAVLASGVPVILFPLDSTQIDLEAPARGRLFGGRSGAAEALARLYDQWRVGNGWGRSTPTLFDVVPTAWLIDPALCAPTPMRIAVDARGFTRRIDGAPNASVCMTGDGAAVVARLLDTLAPQSRKAS
jgi:inosine-uridine nucleoside N-ribohydrolase